MRLRELTDVAFKYRHVITGEVIYALPVLSHVTTHIKTKGNHDRVFLLDMSYFKNTVENFPPGAWVYLKHSEIRRIMMFDTKNGNVYTTTRQKLITDYDEVCDY